MTWLNRMATALALTLLSMSAIAQDLPDVSPQIVDGEPAPTGMYPAYVGLSIHNGDDVRHRCGGSLVAPRWVLTAAHCVPSTIPVESLRANVGMTRFRPGIEATDQVMVKRIVIHPGYNPSNQETRFWYDAALVELERPAHSYRFMPLAPINYGLEPGAELWVAGFGAIDGQTPDVLMHTDSAVLEDPFCAEVPPGYPPTTYNPQVHLCINKAVTGGDSGGPVMRPVHLSGRTYWVQVGIVANSVYPPAEMHTRVPAIYRWVYQTMFNRAAP